MNGVTILGFLLIALGVFGLVVGSVSYTKDKDAVDLGPVHITVLVVTGTRRQRP